MRLLGLLFDLRHRTTFAMCLVCFTASQDHLLARLFLISVAALFT
jgi:hypothetical protein